MTVDYHYHRCPSCDQVWAHRTSVIAARGLEGQHDCPNPGCSGSDRIRRTAAEVGEELAAGADRVARLRGHRPTRPGPGA